MTVAPSAVMPANAGIQIAAAVGCGIEAPSAALTLDPRVRGGDILAFARGAPTFAEVRASASASGKANLPIALCTLQAYS